jgi:alanyl-tRNA synthetase
MRQEWRVEFVCGRRAARIARRDFQLLQRAAQALGSAAEDVPSAIQRATSERDQHFKSMRALLQQLAEVDAARELQTVAPDANGIRIVARAYGEETQPEYLNYLATRLASVEKTIALLGRSADGQLIFAQHPSAAKDMNALLKQLFAQFPGKGGGTRDFARGKLADATQAETATTLAREQLLAG